MGTPKETAAAPAPAAASEFVVAPGRTVEKDGKKYRPGEPVSLTRAELRHLREAGFVIAADAEPVGGAGATVGGLRIQGGRPPGTKVV